LQLSPSFLARLGVIPDDDSTAVCADHRGPRDEILAVPAKLELLERPLDTLGPREDLPALALEPGRGLCVAQLLATALACSARSPECMRANGPVVRSRATSVATSSPSAAAECTASSCLRSVFAVSVDEPPQPESTTRRAAASQQSPRIL
jgi:hypothetical protein